MFLSPSTAYFTRAYPKNKFCRLFGRITPSAVFTLLAISPILLRRVALHLAQSARKYSESIFRICSSALVAALVVSGTGCGGAIPPFQPVQTRAIGFQADKIINNDAPLEIDIIYITYVQELREVTKLGPTSWFKTEKRAQWKFKESFLIKGGQKAMVELDPLILKRTVLLVVYANYKNTADPADKQVIVDYAGKNKEIIYVKQSKLEPKRQSLRYVK